MIQINNTFELDTHPGVTIVNPEIVVVETVDRAAEETFTPHVLVSAPNITIYHELPPQSYVKGTWGDDEVQDAITNYFSKL